MGRDLGDIGLLVGLTAAVLLASVLGGCADRAEVPYLGRWDGRFNVRTVDSTVPIRDPKRNSFRGFILFYRTLNRCALHMEGEQEAVDANGTWRLNAHQIVVTFRSKDDSKSGISIDDAGGADLRDPNKAFIPAKDLKDAFSKTLALNIGANRKELASPLIQIGPLTGSYEFTKDSLGR